MIIWLGIMIVSAIFEIITTDLVSIWLVFGALTGLILNLLHFSTTVQIIAAVIVTLVIAVAVRPFAKNYLRGNIVKTNIDRIIGKETILIRAIEENQKGEVKLNGESWSAISLNNEPIAANEKVVIVGIDGNKLIVRK